MLAMGVLLMGKLMRRRKHVSYILRRATKVKRLQVEMREYMGHLRTFQQLLAMRIAECKIPLQMLIDSSFPQSCVTHFVLLINSCGHQSADLNPTRQSKNTISDACISGDILPRDTEPHDHSHDKFPEDQLG